MRIQFVSDLHLDTWHDTPFEHFLEPVAPILVLCGDIGNIKTYENIVRLQVFFIWVSKRWQKVFWIPGLAETAAVWTEKEDWQTCQERLHKIIEGLPNVFLALREKWISEEGYLVLLCPFWRPHLDGGAIGTQNSMTRWNREDLRWIKECIRETTLPVVVFSYMAPTYTLLNESGALETHQAYYNLESEVLLKSPVVAWVCGHCHQAVQLLRPWNTITGETGQVLLTTNPVGYPHEETGWRREAVLRL